MKTVVPAKAGTHSHRLELLREVVVSSSFAPTVACGCGAGRSAPAARADARPARLSGTTAVVVPRSTVKQPSSSLRGASAPKQSRLPPGRHSGLLRFRLRSLSFGGQVARNDGLIEQNIPFPRHHCARVLQGRRPRNRKRAQGRPGARRTHGPPATKKAGGDHHRFGRNQPAFPARWCYGLYRALPGEPGFLAPVTRERSKKPLVRLAPASGCQDHTALPSVSASLVSRANTSTASRTQRS